MHNKQAHGTLVLPTLNLLLTAQGRYQLPWLVLARYVHSLLLHPFPLPAPACVCLPMLQTPCCFVPLITGDF